MNSQTKLVINPNVMKDLIGDDQQMIRKFEIEFLQQAKISIDKIVCSYKEEHFDNIKEESHYLKTSAKAIGAEQTAELLEQLEQLAVDNNKLLCKQQIIMINGALKRVYGVISNGH